MRRIPVAVSVLIVLVPIWASAQVKVVEESGRDVVLEVDFSAYWSGEQGLDSLPWSGLPPVPYRTCFVSLPSSRGYRVELVDGSFAEEKRTFPPPLAFRKGDLKAPVELPRKGYFPPKPWTESGPFAFRRHYILSLRIFALQVDYGSSTVRRWKRCRLRISFPEVGPSPGRGDPLVKELVLNRARPAGTEGRVQGSPADPHFDLSPNWIKIGVEERGLYVLTGQDIVSLNFGPVGIESATLRLFSSGGINQPRSLQDSSGTWRRGKWMAECALLVKDGGDGFFDPQDTLIFYGMGTSDWLDLYDPQAARTDFYEHPYAKINYYYLTWGGDFGSPPRRMGLADVSPGAGASIGSFEERVHVEKDLVQDFDFGGEGWLWLEIPRSTAKNEKRYLPSFRVEGLISSVPQTFRTLALAPFCGAVCYRDSLNFNLNHHAIYYINGSQVAEVVWDSPYGSRYKDGVEVVASGRFLREGDNTFSIEVPRDLNREDFMYFDFYSLSYRRRLEASSNELAFSTPDSAGIFLFQVGNFTGSAPVYLFDVTDQFQPLSLVNIQLTAQGGARTAAFSYGPGGRRYLWIGTRETLRRPSTVLAYHPNDLRNRNRPVHMVIVCDETMQAAAQTLAAHHRDHLPYFPNAEVLVVTARDVYDNFSGGLKDPMAIRNYCKFLYDGFSDGSGNPALTYLLLFGDANSDYKNRASTQRDNVPTNMNLHSSGLVAYATDDWFALMDLGDENPGLAVPDIGVGRLPAANQLEANLLVGKILAYATSRDFGPWRDQVILVADDEISSRTIYDVDFTFQSEGIAYRHLPGYVQVIKDYLTEFPALGGIKPASRNFLIEHWNRGALVVNYIGHGSSQQLADEQVFLSSDVGALYNGSRLPLFMALSCTVGDFDSPMAKSLSEKLLLREGGGVVAAVAASEVTYTRPNYVLNTAIFDQLFHPQPAGTTPLGVALIAAKLQTLTYPSQGLVENSEKYNLLGDPALSLVCPARSIEISLADGDSLIAGRTKVVSGEVMLGGGVDSTFSGKVELLVRESDDTTGYTREGDGFHIQYRYPGGAMYQGSADVAAGTFTFSIHLPRYPNPGPYAYVLAYADDGLEDAVGALPQVDLVYPSLGGGAPSPVDGPPQVSLGFKGGRTVVKPGAILEARVEDSDGISILNTTSEGKQALVFDGSGVPVDVTSFFTFDHGGTDTSGRMNYPLPSISVGRHQVTYKVADSFGQISLDTLNFEVMEPLAHYAHSVFNYPNPFRSSTSFLFSLSDPGRVELAIYTSSGRKVRELEGFGQGGETWIHWDGRDEVGEEVANGVYLYVGRVKFSGVEEGEVVVRGKVVKIK